MIWSSSAWTTAPSSSSFLITSMPTISPPAASIPICSFRQDRRRDVPRFSNSHSPAPLRSRPVLSTSKCSGPVPARRSGGASSVFARRLKEEWSGTARSSPSSQVTEPIRPSVCRSVRPKTLRSVSAVVIAGAEYCGLPFGVVRSSARHAALASAGNHTIRPPRFLFLNEASCSDQFVTRFWAWECGDGVQHGICKARLSWASPCVSPPGRL